MRALSFENEARKLVEIGLALGQAGHRLRQIRGTLTRERLPKLGDNGFLRGQRVHDQRFSTRQGKAVWKAVVLR